MQARLPKQPSACWEDSVARVGVTSVVDDCEACNPRVDIKPQERVAFERRSPGREESGVHSREVDCLGQRPARRWDLLGGGGGGLGLLPRRPDLLRLRGCREESRTHPSAGAAPRAGGQRDAAHRQPAGHCGTRLPGGVCVHAIVGAPARKRAGSRVADEQRASSYHTSVGCTGSTCSGC